jgi:fatty acid desaturase
MNSNQSTILIVGGILSLLASLLHVAIIIGGAEWYRFFGAGEDMASMSENGSMIPGVVTFFIALVLLLWALYAFSGARVIRRLPFLKGALVLISAIYLIRGLAIIPAYFVQPDVINGFLIWSSVICSLYGILYFIGTVQIWGYLSGIEGNKTP